MKFLVIDGALLRNRFLKLGEKAIICFLLNLAKQNKCYYGQYDYLSDIFGISIETCMSSVRNLLKKGLIVQTSAGLTTTHNLDYYINYFPGVNNGNCSQISQSSDSSVN
jgi:hypothetical protein